MAVCSSCGGSGVKRVSEGRFRTCQDCLGRGVHMQSSGSVTPVFARSATTPVVGADRNSGVGLIKAMVSSASAR